MWHYVVSRNWRNLHRDIEIDRNQRSEELLKLGGGQKIFIFRGGGEGGLALLGKSQEIFIFRRGCPMREKFLGEGSYPSAYYG